MRTTPALSLHDIEDDFAEFDQVLADEPVTGLTMGKLIAAVAASSILWGVLATLVSKVSL